MYASRRTAISRNPGWLLSVETFRSDYSAGGHQHHGTILQMEPVSGRGQLLQQQCSHELPDPKILCTTSGRTGEKDRLRRKNK